MVYSYSYGYSYRFTVNYHVTTSVNLSHLPSLSWVNIVQTSVSEADRRPHTSDE